MSNVFSIVPVSQDSRFRHCTFARSLGTLSVCTLDRPLLQDQEDTMGGSRVRQPAEGGGGRFQLGRAWCGTQGDIWTVWLDIWGSGNNGSPRDLEMIEDIVISIGKLLGHHASMLTTVIATTFSIFGSYVCTLRSETLPQEEICCTVWTTVHL